jgi:hypothetical protein
VTRRNGIVWSMVGSLGLAFLLILVCHPVALSVASAGMSAPPLPAVSVEGAARAHLVQSRIDGPALMPASSRLSISLAELASSTLADPYHCRKLFEFAPLHRRPPPSLS